MRTLAAHLLEKAVEPTGDCLSSEGIIAGASD
jgi:hypothetical protein